MFWVERLRHVAFISYWAAFFLIANPLPYSLTYLVSTKRRDDADLDFFLSYKDAVFFFFRGSEIWRFLPNARWNLNRWNEVCQGSRRLFCAIEGKKPRLRADKTGRSFLRKICIGGSFQKDHFGVSFLFAIDTSFAFTRPIIIHLNFLFPLQRRDKEIPFHLKI